VALAKPLEENLAGGRGESPGGMSAFAKGERSGLHNALEEACLGKGGVLWQATILLVNSVSLASGPLLSSNSSFTIQTHAPHSAVCCCHCPAKHESHLNGQAVGPPRLWVPVCGWWDVQCWRSTEREQPRLCCLRDYAFSPSPTFPADPLRAPVLTP
jgi:hypothetical protein